MELVRKQFNDFADGTTTIIKMEGVKYEREQI